MTKWSINKTVITAVVVACTLAGAASIGVALYFSNKEFVSGLIDKAQMIHGRIDEVALYVAKQGFLKSVSERLVKQYGQLEMLPKEEKEVVLKALPIYAAMQVASANADKDFYKFRVFADSPRNKDNAMTEGELKIYNIFKNDPKLKDYIIDQGDLLTVYRPVRVYKDKGCMTCHGDPATSPWGNGKDILGYDMENWDDGYLHGVFAVIQNKSEVHKAQTEAGKGGSTPIMVAVMFVVAMISVAIVAKIIAKPIKNLISGFERLKHDAVSLMDAQKRVKSSSQSLSSAVTEQAAALEEVAASIEQISAMVSRNTENAQSADQFVDEGAQKSQQVQETSGTLTSGIGELGGTVTGILDQVRQGNDQMSEIARLIGEIAGKTKVINEIAFQTKILSFNASVEAARAGEHGKGFAVVAEEVGNLAEMSGSSAKEISEMLGDSVKKVKEIIENWQTQSEQMTQQANEKVQGGIDLTEQTSQALGEITEVVTRIQEMVKQIAEASREQAVGVSEINKAISEMSTTTQLNASSSQALSSESEKLGKLAEHLDQTVQELSLVVSGSKS